MKRTSGARLALFATLCVSAPVVAAPGAEAAAEPAPSWAFSALAYVYVVPDDTDYLQPSFVADHDVLHLEARYNYEDKLTGSLWAGYTFSGGGELGWEITPMFGGVFGATSGVAPGGRGSLGYWKLELYSEGEYLFDFKEPTASLFYNWSELTVAPLEWFRLGLVTQRTRVYTTDRSLQRGVLAGVSYGMASLTAYLLNPDDSGPIWILGASLGFDNAEPAP